MYGLSSTNNNKESYCLLFGSSPDDKLPTKIFASMKILLSKLNIFLVGCLVVVSSCNKGSFGGGDESKPAAKTKIAVEAVSGASQGKSGRGKVVIKSSSKLVAKCVAPCKLSFSELPKDKNGLFSYEAPFAYKYTDKFASGQTLKCSVIINVSGSKNKEDNKNGDLVLRFCRDRKDGRSCDNKNVVEECPIL